MLSTGKEVNAKVVNYDANYDVAVVKITDKIQIPAVVELGDSNSLQVGEAKQYALPIGLYIQTVSELSPAEKAGLKSGDIIIKFDGQKISTFDDINALKSKHKSGDEVSLTIDRSGKEMTLSLKLADQS